MIIEGIEKNTIIERSTWVFIWFTCCRVYFKKWCLESSSFEAVKSSRFGLAIAEFAQVEHVSRIIGKISHTMRLFSISVYATYFMARLDAKISRFEFEIIAQAGVDDGLIDALIWIGHKTYPIQLIAVRFIQQLGGYYFLKTECVTQAPGAARQLVDRIDGKLNNRLHDGRIDQLPRLDAHAIVVRYADVFARSFGWYLAEQRYITPSQFGMGDFLARIETGQVAHRRVDVKRRREAI